MHSFASGTDTNRIVAIVDGVKHAKHEAIVLKGTQKDSTCHYSTNWLSTKGSIRRSVQLCMALWDRPSRTEGEVLECILFASKVWGGK